MPRHTAPALVTALLAAASAPAAAQPTAGAPIAVAYAERAVPADAVWRRWDGEAWSAEVAAWAGPDMVVWQELRTCSDWVRMARVSLEWGGAARLQLFDGSTWGAPAELTGDAGSRSTKVVAAAFEHTSGDVLTVYREQDSTSLRFRTHTGVLSGESAVPGLTLNAPPRWVTLASKPGSDEIVLLAATSSRLYGAVWDGAAWGSAVTLETSLPGVGRAFDLAYTTQSGHALAVWAPSGGAPRARVWTGLAWGSAVTLPSAGADVRWIALAANPSGSSDEVLLATLDTARDVNLARWDGLAWGAFTEVEADAAAADEPRVDLAFQPDGGSALAVWHADGHSALRYRTWNGVAWSPTQVGPDIGMPTRRIALTPGREGDEVVLAARGYVPGGASDYVMYSTNANVEPNSSQVNGPVAARLPDVDLPPAPTPGSGGANLSYGNNKSITLPPGTYGQATFGNACTLDLTSGTYRFESLQAANDLTINGDTSGGDIVVIITNGSFQADNNQQILNTGGGRIAVVLLNGNFQIKNNGTIDRCDIVAYNGNIEMDHNTDVTGLLHARGNVKIVSGTVEAPMYLWPGAGRLSAVVWRAGTPGPRVDLSASPSGAPSGGAVALADRPRAARRTITGWMEIDPTE